MSSDFIVSVLIGLILTLVVVVIQALTLSSMDKWDNIMAESGLQERECKETSDEDK